MKYYSTNVPYILKICIEIFYTALYTRLFTVFHRSQNVAIQALYFDYFRQGFGVSDKGKIWE